MIANFIRYQRQRHNLTQQQLATKAGLGLRFIRELENGKLTIRMDKANQVLGMFGFDLLPVKTGNMDAYDTYFKYVGKMVKVTYNNRMVISGLLLREDQDPETQRIDGWYLVINSDMPKYIKQPIGTPATYIMHQDISKIELQ